MAQIKLDEKKLQDKLFEYVPGLKELDDSAKKETAKKIQESIKDSKASPLDTDVWIYRMVVIALGLVILFTVTGILFVFNENSTVPETLTALGSGALGALAGLLAPSPKQGNG